MGGGVIPRMQRIAVIGWLGLAVGWSNTALAWDPFGHMMVAESAYRQLTPPVRAKVAALLERNPRHASWIAGVTPADQDEISFLKASTWPDAIKSMPGFRNDGHYPSDPSAAQNIGYADPLQHRYWHFIDQPFSPDRTALIAPLTPNAQTQITEFRRVLASPAASPDLKSYDLVWLIHLVGDAHQPLHATSRFDRAQRRGDAGGNRVRVCPETCGAGTTTLHVFWDDVLGTGDDPQAARIAARSLAPATASAASIDDESKWIDESLALAKSSVYTGPIGLGKGPYALTEAYKTKAKSLAQKRVALAGARLARLLNQAMQ